MIQIGMDPLLLNTSLFVISWHGLFSFFAVAFAVLMVGRWVSPRKASNKPASGLGKAFGFLRGYFNYESDAFLGKLENELQGTIQQVRKVSDQYFKDLRIREKEGAPEGIALGSGNLSATLKELNLGARTRVTVVTRTGALIADTEDNQWVRDTATIHGELRRVLRGEPYSYVRLVNGEERAVFMYPVLSERPVELTVEFQGEPGKGKERVLLQRTDRWVGGAVRIEMPTGEVRIRTVDAVYSVAIAGIIGGILGSRVVHVADEWAYYSANPGNIIAIWNGGIGLWGAILGGSLGGLLAAKRYKLPAGKIADLCAMVMLPAQAIGRIGDIINGEHISKVTQVPWGFVWSHPGSPTFQQFGLTSTHPAVVYEMIWDLLLFFVLWRFVRGRIKPDGMLFVAYLAFYSFGRYFVQYYRSDRIWFAGLQEAQVIALLVMLVAVPVLAYRSRIIWQDQPVEVAPPPQQRRARRATAKG